ncbi:MAG: DUF362 domain-containing protein [Desulfobacterales bacterium]|jgi:hypothetical protein
MTSKVHFIDLRATVKENFLRKLDRLVDAAGFGDIVFDRDLTAVKLHFGEAGNTAFIRPVFIRRVVEAVRRCGGLPQALADLVNAEPAPAVSCLQEQPEIRGGPDLTAAPDSLQPCFLRTFRNLRSGPKPAGPLSVIHGDQPAPAFFRMEMGKIGLIFLE